MVHIKRPIYGEFQNSGKTSVADNSIVAKILDGVGQLQSRGLFSLNRFARQTARIKRAHVLKIMRNGIWSSHSTKPNSVSDRNFSSLGRLTKKKGTCIFRPFPNGRPGLGDGVEWE